MKWFEESSQASVVNISIAEICYYQASERILERYCWYHINLGLSQTIESKKQ